MDAFRAFFVVTNEIPSFSPSVVDENAKRLAGTHP